MRPLFALFMTLSMVSCDNDSNMPDLVIGSNSTNDTDVHMSVYAESIESQTELSFYLHRHHSKGFAQYLILNGDDSLNVASDEWDGALELHTLPSNSTSMIAYYSSDLEDDTPGRTVSATVNRGGAPLIASNITLLENTEHTVTTDTETLGLQSTIHVEWTAINEYQYQLRFEFRCEKPDGRTTGFRVRYPSSSHLLELESPFDLDMGQFSSPAEGSSNCEVEVVLISMQDQTASQAFSGDQLDATVLRQQSTVLPLTLN